MVYTWFGKAFIQKKQQVHRDKSMVKKPAFHKLKQKHGLTLTVYDYMLFSLHDPEFGYYCTRDPLGVDGDFVTAPEISQVFGEICGLWLVHLYENLGQPNPISILELGPGKGSLMRDCLRAFRICPSLEKNISLHMVEINPHLKAAQRQACTPSHIHHYDTLEAALLEIKGPLLVIANEFFDALPIRQFHYHNNAWYERSVSINPDNDMLSYGLSTNPIELSTILKTRPKQPPQEGDILETNPQQHSLFHAILEHISNHGGGGLVIDYGYDAPCYGDTLQAVSKHRYADPLHNPGHYDLTSHVNFADLLAIIQEFPKIQNHLQTQGQFLTSLGVHQRTQSLMASTTDIKSQNSIYEATKRLVDPKQMGTLFKALSFWNGAPSK